MAATFATDSFGFDPEFLAQFEKPHSTARAGPYNDMFDEDEVLDEPTTFAGRLLMAFTNVVFLVTFLFLVLCLALTTATIVMIHRGPWEPDGLAFLAGIVARFV